MDNIVRRLREVQESDHLGNRTSFYGGALTILRALEAEGYIGNATKERLENEICDLLFEKVKFETEGNDCHRK